MTLENQQFQEINCRLDELAKKQETSLTLLTDFDKRLQDLKSSQEDFFHRLLQEHQQMSYSQKILNDEQITIANSCQKTSDERQQKLDGINHERGVHHEEEELHNDLVTQRCETLELQKKLESEIRVLTLKAEVSHKMSVESHKIIRQQLFQLVDKLNILGYNVKFLTDKLDKIQLDTENQIQDTEDYFEEMDFRNGNGTKISEGRRFSIANIENGNMFLGDVSVQGHIVGQVDVRQFIEGDQTFLRTEIKNINRKNIYLIKRKISAAGVPRQRLFTGGMKPGSPEQPERRRTSTVSTETDPLEELDLVVQPPTKVQDEKMPVGRLVVLGGRFSLGLAETCIADTWCQEDVLDGPDDQTLAVTAGDVIIVIEEEKKRARSLDVLSKKWTELEPPPVYRPGMATAIEGNRVYLTGGEGHSTRCDIYDVQLNSWSEGPNLKGKRWSHGSATLAGKVYCSGGWNGKGKPDGKTEMYDPSKEGKKRWSTVAQMSVPRSQFALTACNRFLWAVGGWSGLSSLLELERYDPEMISWTKLATMKERRSCLSASFCNGQLYAIGGYCLDYLDTVEVYDPEQDRWRDGEPLTRRRDSHASCVVHSC